MTCLVVKVIPVEAGVGVGDSPISTLRLTMILSLGATGRGQEGGLAQTTPSHSHLMTCLATTPLEATDLEMPLVISLVAMMILMRRMMAFLVSEDMAICIAMCMKMKNRSAALETSILGSLRTPSVVQVSLHKTTEVQG